ncbi:MAG: MDR family MFS transporter [Pseudohongiellaceae bacterium]|nr:MDR family MFS transporter [Pseudohongiellaceae bacterium]
MNELASGVLISDKDKRTTLTALLILFLLAALDMTILSTAMPRIVSELNGLELFSWVTTAYMLTSTVLVPIFGKLGDLYGRKLILTIGVTIFLLGSMLCGISGEFGDLPILGDGMRQLIAFRAIKGIGGAALFTSAIGIVADIYPPLKRAKFMGLFGAMFGVASIIGPALGGFLTDFATVTLFGHEIAGWRWVFYANVPLGIIALCMVIFKTPRLNHGNGGKIDYLGAALLLVVFIPFLLALTWGGNRYPWDSPTLISMFALSLVSLLLFIWVESRTKDAIMPLSLFQSRVFVITNLCSFVVGMAFLGVVMFMPLFMQVVLGVNATNSGFSMFPLMSGLMVGSILSGRFVSKSGNYKPYMVGGTLILLVGVFLLTTIDTNTSLGGMAWRMLIVGLGLGPSQSLVNLIVQSAFPLSQIGVATSSTQFFRQIGNTVGVAIFGSLLTLNLAKELPAQVPMLAANSGASVDISAAQTSAMNPGALRQQIEESSEALIDTLSLAYHGDSEALAAVEANALVPDQLKEQVSAAAAQSLSETEIEQRLSLVRSLISSSIDDTVESVSTGIRTAFSNSVTAMFSTSLWIIVLGFLLSIFIPVIPLHRDNEVKKEAVESAE